MALFKDPEYVKYLKDELVASNKAAQAKDDRLTYDSRWAELFGSDFVGEVIGDILEILKENEGGFDFMDAEPIKQELADGLREAEGYTGGKLEAEVNQAFDELFGMAREWFRIEVAELRLEQELQQPSAPPKPKKKKETPLLTPVKGVTVGWATKKKTTAPLRPVSRERAILTRLPRPGSPIRKGQAVLVGKKKKEGKKGRSMIDKLQKKLAKCKSRSQERHQKLKVYRGRISECKRRSKELKRKEGVVKTGYKGRHYVGGPGGKRCYID